MASFKSFARLGDATWGQAKIAVVIGFILAVIQFVTARKFLKYNTYLEKAFLGFLLVGTAWVYLLPENPAHFFVDHSVALLYLTLFLMSLIPQLLGYDPSTYAVAKQWYPEAVWGTPDFRFLNYRITYVWSGVFFACFLSSFLGKGKPLYSIVIPFARCIGIGVVFSKKYPDIYLKHRAQVQRIGDTVLKAYRWQYILSGVEDERFANVIGNLVSEGQGQRIGEALLPLTI